MGKELELAIKIGGRLDKSLGSAVNNAQKQLNSISSVANKVGMAVTAGVVTAGVKLAVDSVNTYKDYQSALNSAAATAGIERDTAEYEAMNAAAREAGRTTIKTAKESANALEYMALAGWSVEDSTKALMPVLKLSAATGAELATTSDLVTDSMANLGLGINDLNHYLDVSATANNKSNQTAMQLQEAYLGVGGVLKNLNSPIEESAAVLGVLANRGTKGSEAGTALNAILVNMQKRSGDAYKAMSQLGVSMYDSGGKARSIIDVFQEISDKTSGMTEENRNLMYQMIGGKSHLDSFAKIMQGFTTDTADGTKEVYSLINAFQNCDGALDKLYGIKTDTLEGSLATLNSAFDDMKISIGEQIAPTLNDAVKNLTAKMPQIEKIITQSLERIIPAMSKVLNYVVDNADSVISAVTNIAKAFIGFKIAGGTIKGINNFVDLIKNLSKISATTGLTKTMTGVIGSLTGISTAGGTVSGAIMGLVGSFAAAVGPATLAAAAIFGVAAAVNAIHEHRLNYANGMNEAADGIEKASNALIKYNDMAAEIPKLREIIGNPESSTQDVDNAKARLQEIADLLSKEYNLTINADTSSLENAVNMAQQLSRTDLINESGNLIKKATKGASSYKTDIGKIPGLEQQQKQLQDQQILYSQMQSEAEQFYTSFENGQISNEKYLAQMNELYSRARESGAITDTTGIGDKITNYNSSEFLRKLSNGFLTVTENLKGVNGELELANSNVAEFDSSTQKAGDFLTQALASDVKNNNAYGAESDISMIKQLGETLVSAGKNTDELSTKFAIAKTGYTDFAEAIANGKTAEMSQNFIDFKKSIGDTAESAVSGAAVIASGFENVTKATEAGNDAVLSVIGNMKSLGDTQGIFDGLDSSGVADKLTDMAHAMNLIPENKSISIDANGNFEIIAEAENQIASLRSQGNVDVSVNANGDFSVLDTVTGEIQTLQGIGATNLQVNADGNIDVLNKAQEVIATIDSKSAQINIDGQAYGLEQIQQAKQTADGLHDKSVTAAVVGSFNGQDIIATAVDYQSKLQDVSRSQTVTGKFPGKSDIATAISYQSQLHDKSVTHTVTYVQKGTPPANNATGTSNWRGGLTYINDQKISDPREVIEHNGMRYWYEGKNVLANIPRGARIYNAAESRAFINGSHRNGLMRVPFDGYIAELHADERVLTADEAEDYRENGLLARAIDRLDEALHGGGKKQQNDGDSGDKQIIFSPTYQIYGNTDKEEIREAGRSSYKDFVAFMERYERDKRRKEF